MTNRRQEFGDWQTPIELARTALRRVSELVPGEPATVVEPTCGQGSFLVAAGETFRSAKLRGYEINAAYVEEARRVLDASRARVETADFFSVPWERELEGLAQPILVTGNPPWVTNAALGSLGSGNLPDKHNFKSLKGLEARTGRSNFDVSEWMILRLVEALQSRRATLAVLCKTAVARRVIEFCANRRVIGSGSLFRIDAKRYFGAAVDASLFVCAIGPGPTSARAARWPVYPELDAARVESTMAMWDGVLVADAERVARTAHLLGTCVPEWRSGMKHDCSRIMELDGSDGAWRNGEGDQVDLEDDFVFPLLKSSDLARGNDASRRAVVVPQRALGDDTSVLRERAPKLWRYLSAHRDVLEGRKSSIYRSQPAFSVFGIGPYSFAPWKVAISGLYKRFDFRLIGPHEGRPVILDDTCYFLPFERRDEAAAACEALLSPTAQDFLAGRVFWDAKRSINKALLQSLDLAALLSGGAPRKPRQGSLALLETARD